MPEDDEVGAVRRREALQRDVAKTDAVVPRAVHPARARGAKRQSRAEVGMHQTEGPHRERVAQNRPQQQVATIGGTTEPIPMFDHASPLADGKREWRGLIRDTHLAAQHLAAPAIVIAGYPGDRHPGRAQFRQRAKDGQCERRHGAAPLEPEIEDVAVQHQRAWHPAQSTEKLEQRLRGGRRGRTHMAVGEDVAGRVAHQRELSPTGPL